MSKTTPSVGNFLLYKRESRHMTLGQLAQISGIARPTLSLIEQGKVMPIEPDLKNLAVVLEFNMSEAEEYVSGRKEFSYTSRKSHSTPLEFATFLAERRTAKGLSVDELAKAAGFNRRKRAGVAGFIAATEIIEAFESGKTMPTLRQLGKLATVLDFEFNDIMPYFTW